GGPAAGARAVSKACRSWCRRSRSRRLHRVLLIDAAPAPTITAAMSVMLTMSAVMQGSLSVGHGADQPAAGAMAEDELGGHRTKLHGAGRAGKRSRGGQLDDAGALAGRCVGRCRQPDAAQHERTALVADLRPGASACAVGGSAFELGLLAGHEGSGPRGPATRCGVAVRAGV